MKKTSPYGRAPPRSRKARLSDKGYVEMAFPGGRIGVTEVEARKIVKKCHDAGIPAQAVYINPFNEGSHWTVMYKKIPRKSPRRL